MALFAEVPQFPQAHYNVNVSWGYLEDHLKLSISEFGLDLEPDFQRAHVWTREQQIAYIEYILRGGEVGRNLTFNAVGWDNNFVIGTYVIVDGKQRLEAVRAFLRGDIPAFGHYRSEYTDSLRLVGPDFVWRICALRSKKEILELYLNINAGGTPHTQEELDRVRSLLKECS